MRGVPCSLFLLLSRADLTLNPALCAEISFYFTVVIGIARPDDLYASIMPTPALIHYQRQVADENVLQSGVAASIKSPVH